MSSSPAPRTLRSHLLWLTLGTLLPMLLFGVVAIVLITVRERDLMRSGAIERARALLTAVDAELGGHVASLKGLAKSRDLEEDRLPSFLEEIERTVPTQPYWRSVSLAMPSGQRVLDSRDELVADLASVSERESFQDAVASRKPVVGDLYKVDGAQRFAVRVPVDVGGELRYVLSAIVDPRGILGLLSEQRLPADWFGVVVDGEHRIVARTVDHEGMFGHPASDSLRRALTRGVEEGWFRGSTIEGDEVYTSFNRSSQTGWAVAIGVPAPYVQASVRRAVWLLGTGIVVAVVLAVLLATALSRRISQPIASLVTLARALGRGTPLQAPHTGDVQEVADVTRALLASAETVREREEALRAADRAKDEFLAMLGHELRNPLSAISSAAQVLKVAGPAEGPLKQSAEVVGRQVEHMTRLVDDLLDVSRVTRGKITLDRKPLDLGQLVRNALDVLRRAEKLDGHELAVDTRTVWVDADEARLEQIVSNLVNNAVKYTPEHGRIAVRVRREDGDAVLEVEDTGVGLPPELVDRVFDLFVQGERSIDRGLGGLGIGLTLVRRLAELHGGSARAASAGTDRGSCFTVRLPAIEPPVPTAPRRAVPDGAGEHRRVLLIEDNDDARETLHAALELHGYEVFEADEGPAGLDAAAALRPAAAVVDIGLPGLDGYEVARRLRATRHGANMLLLALTGYGQAESRRRALEAGFDDYLTKPVAPDALARRLASGLAEREANHREADHRDVDHREGHGEPAR